MILKVLTYLFSKKYDYKYSSNCYSFRRKITVKKAFKDLSKNKNISKLYGYKMDISNYFNSINTELMLNKLKIFLEEDEELNYRRRKRYNGRNTNIFIFSKYLFNVCG